MPGENENENEDLTVPSEGDNTPPTPEPSQEDAGELPVNESEEGLSEESEPDIEDPETEAVEEEPAADKVPAQGEDAVAKLQAQLQAIQAQQADERKVLYDLLQKQERARTATPPPDRAADVPREAIRLALFGGDAAQWNAFPKDVQAKALKIANEHVARTVDEALDPNVRLQGIRQGVGQLVQEQVQPLLEDYHDRKAQELTQKHWGSVKDPSVVKRAREIFPQMPGADSGNWKQIDKALAAATAQAKVEIQEKKEQQAKNNEQAKKVQSGKTGGTKLKPTKTGGPSSPASLDNPPPMKPGERLTDYHDRIRSLAK